MSYQAGTPANNSKTAVDNTPINEERQLVSDPSHTPKKRSPWKWIIIGFIALAVVVVAVVVPVYYKVIKPRSGNSSSNSSGNGGGNGGGDPEDEIPDLQEDGAITGGDGSKIFTLEGEFTYTNPFGGTWYFDPVDPLNDSAQAQSYTPPLNQSWTWGTDKVYGVNLGGWLVLEPFISPALFEKYSDAAVPPIDEYSLMEAKRADGTLDEIEEHYRTFITEKDFADIAGAGLNWIRLPVGFWAISTMENEPYYEGASWKYVLKAITWALNYGLRINLDLHAHPGSQNGWNHSGFGRGPEGANWLRGLMGIANAQRSLDYIRIITQFISQPQYSSVVQMFGIVNEPRIGAAIDRAAVETFNYQAYIMMREITGIGAGKGPIISIHDGFFDTTSWHTFLNGADRLALDTHPYFAFDGPNADPVESYVPRPCERWATGINGTQQQFGIITAGEWSAAVNDCGLFVTGVNGGPLYAGNCADWDDWASWDELTKNALLEFTQASMDALQNWFFWTWRIGESLEFGSVRAPFWSYKLGYDNGWIPRDPRSAIGKCTELGVGGSNPFSGEFLAWQTGGDEAAQPTVTAPYVQWPPVTLGVIPAEAMAFLPTYTPTGTITTLHGPVFTGADVDLGDGWFDDDDTAGMMVPIAGCSYPDAYSVASVFPIPVAPVCGPGAQPLPSDPTLPEEVPIPTTITDAPIQTDTVITSDGIETTIAVPPV